MISIHILTTIIDRFLDDARSGCWELDPGEVLIKDVTCLEAEDLMQVTVVHHTSGPSAGECTYFVDEDGNIV